jgi:hypothetical protein
VLGMAGLAPATPARFIATGSFCWFTGHLRQPPKTMSEPKMGLTLRVGLFSGQSTAVG